MLLARRVRRDQLPPVLRHQRPGRPEHRAARTCSRAVHQHDRSSWLAAGQLDGLRIDHPDGLYDPKQYFDRLQESYARLAVARHLLATSRPSTAGLPGRRPRAHCASGSRPARTGRCTSSSRRSSATTSRCRTTGRPTAPPATSSSTWSTACSSTRPARRALHPRLPASCTGRRRPVRRARLPQEDPDPAVVAGQRAAHARPPARPAGPGATAGAATSPSTACGTPCAR